MFPGNDVKKATKAVGLNVDCVCLDCEDAVALNRKEEARETVCVSVCACAYVCVRECA